MADYIDRKAALESICFDCSAANDCLANERCVDYERMKQIPAADVAPVVHGHWIEIDDEFGLTYECSECHIEGVLYGDYCPNCGAKMEETNERT